MEQAPTVVAFAAPSGTGKTTLITRLVEHLCEQGHRVGAIKSDAHGVDLDTPGKDTHRMRASGAATTALVSHDQVAVFRDAPGEPLPLRSVVEAFFGDVDFVLAEGFRGQGYPTIVVARRGVDFEGWSWPENVVAVASDGPHEDFPVVGLDDVAALARLVEGLPRSAEQAARVEARP